MSYTAADYMAMASVTALKTAKAECLSGDTFKSRPILAWGDKTSDHHVYCRWWRTAEVSLLCRLDGMELEAMPQVLRDALPEIIDEAINAIPPEPKWWEFWK